ncbi:MAG: proprotein convertase P-domain-containing protein [Bacteroidota bacterium]
MYAIHKESRSNLRIPDNNAEGLKDTIKVLQAGTVKDIQVNIDITHSFISDLEVKLITPTGQTIDLHTRGGEDHNDLKTTYDKTVLASVLETASAGEWTLQVKDFAPKDQGLLNAWSIEMKCEGHINEIYLPVQAEAISSVQDCRVSGRVTDLNLEVQLEHPEIGDIQLVLFAPSGKAVVVHDFSGGHTNHLNAHYNREVLAKMIGEATQGAWTLQVKDRSGQQRGHLKKWKLEFKYQDVDDLKKMEGIGPKIEQLLNNANIYSWSKLSVTHPTRIREILIAGGDRFKMHDPTTWPQQAKLAAAGDWERLQKWQDELDGGRIN